LNCEQNLDPCDQMIAPFQKKTSTRLIEGVRLL
jgi:hypothetical protein